ncbi:TetR/AcrR family transcriptional regulator [Streptomyces sp. NBC_01803]|uniref:TetR/AcrR family transcriptional regulator n=1 Tax=Streptomyces sp. NBC_01803 TaxID=2975946 RepID=UPI002DDB6822|nr:TetR family transcriptional regulator [Streptomyces sp. NBC_01803]WSA43269.1 TetR/AcrR family transcriptional regulator [Streptomyces sp. NBC_01803]
MAGDVRPPGPRELRRRRTHEELLRAGLELFLQRGYGKTTVGEIVQHAAVSERTFFRYFASKEELVLHPVREASDLLLAEVIRRPAPEAPLLALRRSFASLPELMPDGCPERYLAAMRVLCSEPETQVVLLRFAAEDQHRLASALAGREGIGTGDRRPKLLAGAFVMSAIHAALAWEERRDGSLAGLMSGVESHLALLPSAVMDGWRTDGTLSG